MLVLIYLILGLCLLIFVFWMITFVYTSFRGSPYVPINNDRLKEITSFIKPGDRVAELGAGDGRVMIEVIKRGAEYVEGWELDAGVFALAKRNIGQAIKQHRLDAKKLKLNFGDFWQAKLSNFNVVYVYQMTKYMKPMKDKVISQLKKGTLVISPDYEIPGMKLYKKIDDGDKGLYLYKV